MRALGVGVLVALMGWVVYEDHRSRVEDATAGFERDERATAAAKALEVQRFFEEFYRSLRAISLIPPVRRIEHASNLPAGADSAVALGWFSPESSDVVQQFYNTLALTVPVSEVYVTMRGFEPSKGESPFLMYDELVLGGSAVDGGAPEPADFPEEYEGAEYAALLDQLAWFGKEHPTYDYPDARAIPARLSPSVRTCDNSQYYSKRTQDVRDAFGQVLSLPIYREGAGGELLGVISGVFRTNQLEALLTGAPFVVVTPADEARARAEHLTPPPVARFALVSADLGLVVADRRNPDLAGRVATIPVGDGPTATRRTLTDLPGGASWDLVYEYDMPVLEATLAELHHELLLRLGAVGIVGLVALFGLWRESLGRAAVDAALARAEQANDALGDGNRRMRLILDSVAQGLVRVDAAGRMEEGASAALVRWLGSYAPGVAFADHLARLDPGFGGLWRMSFEAFVDDVLPQDLCREQMPRALKVGSLELELEYVVLGAEGAFRGLLIVVADVTERQAAHRARMEQQEILELAQRISRDRAGAHAFFEEAGEVVVGLATGAWERDLPGLRRALHTLKGTSSLVGLQVLASLAHRLEDLVEESGRPPGPEAIAALVQRWRVLEETARLFGAEDNGVVRVGAAELAALREHLAAMGRGDLAGRVARWGMEPVQTELERQGERVRALGRRLGKGDVQVRIEGGGVVLDPAPWRPLWGALSHVVRNAVDHGLYDAAEAPEGYRPVVTLRCVERSDGLEISVADNGRGVQWDRLAAALRARGLPAETREDLVAGMFADGVSSRTEVSETSGRGVGMAAVKEAALARGGQVRVESEPGEGTRFVFWFPRAVAVAA